MSSILTNELSKGISWIGIKETLPFGNTNVVGLIVGKLSKSFITNFKFLKKCLV